jgi:hypothetical protein
MSSKEIEDVNTLAFHIFGSLAYTCLAWVLFAKPLMSDGPNKSLMYMVASVIIWCIIFPIIMIASGATSNSISGETSFVNIKVISVSVFMIVLQSFIFAWCKGYKYPKQMTIVLILLFSINIAEAVYTQYENYKEPPIEQDNNTDKTLNIVNAGVGLVQLIILFIWLYKNSSIMKVKQARGNIEYSSGLDTWFIIAYTFWNLLFRIQLLSNSSTLLFFCVSLLLPLVVHLTKKGDWLQIRGVGLVALLVFTFGLSNNNGNILPLYNKQGYEEKSDEDLIITKIQKNETFRYTLLILGIITTLISIYNVSTT